MRQCFGGQAAACRRTAPARPRSRPLARACRGGRQARCGLHRRCRAVDPARRSAPVRRAAATASIRGPITTTVAAGISGFSAANRCAIIGRPATGCMTLGIADFIRVPLPAARMMAAKSDWLIDCDPNQTTAPVTVAQPRRVYNTQIVANCSPTTQRLSRDNARRAGSRRWRSDRIRPPEAARESH